jgi:hypothetical protein
MVTKPKANEGEIEITPIAKERLNFCILGTTPFIANTMSEKARQELLAPAGRKTAADRASNVKHNPMREYRASCYMLPDAPSAIGIMSTAFKGAMRNAALDIPGSSKSQIGRLTYVVGDYVPLFGVPQISMMTVRSSDMNRTPDIRTRAIFPRWATIIGIEYVTPLLRANAVVNLLAAAGITQGVGDGRPEKGKMSYGQFEIVAEDDSRFVEILRTGGRAAQLDALRNPICYDTETEKMLVWFSDIASKRGYKLDDPAFEATFSTMMGE